MTTASKHRPEREDRLVRRIFDRIAEPALVLGSDDRIELINRAAAGTFFADTAPQALIGTPFETLGAVIVPFRASASREETLEVRLATPTGERLFQTTLERVSDDCDTQLLVIMNDLTPLQRAQDELEQKIADRTFDLAVANEQLKAEMAVRLKVNEELKAMREFMSALLEHAPFPVFARDRAQRYVLVNRAWEEISGVSRAAAMGRTPADVFPPDFAARCDASNIAVLNSRGSCCIEETVESDAGTRVFQMVKFPLLDHLGEVEVVCGIALDITEKRLAEEMLAESEKRFRALFENSIDGIQLSRPDGTILAANPAACRMLGRSEEEIRSIGNDGIMDPSDQRLAPLREALRRDGSCTGELTFLRSDGSAFPVGLSCSVFKERRGPHSIVTVWRDISERKKNEAALLQSEERYRNLVELSTNAIYITIDDRLVFSNRAGVKLLGASDPGEVLGRSFLDFIHPECHDAERERVRAVTQEGATVSVEERYVTLDGSVADVDVATIPFTFQDEPALLVLARDITERKKLEEELEKNTRFESIGLLAGGIAHDFNNLLAAILGNISLSKMLTSEEAETHHLLSEAENASLRARDLTRQLLTFARGGAPVKKSATVGELITETCAFALRGSNVSCIFDIPAGLSNVEVDVGQISQVVQNLVINADQAMPEGGTLVVVCENVASPEQIPPQLGGRRCVRISIRDSGHGIHADHLKRIFDPYFTTKQKGSGLGLSTAFSIVRKHDGCITVESELGKGTVFHIYLPASEAPPPPEENAPPLSFSGNGKVLFMDDEEAVRFIAGRTLRRMGFDVVFAKDGVQAVNLYDEALQQGERFHAVVMDLTIPGGMGGREAVRQMRLLDPELKAFVSSGYSDDPVMADPAAYGFCGGIPKPFLYEEMVAALQHVFGKLEHTTRPGCTP